MFLELTFWRLSTLVLDMMTECNGFLLVLFFLPIANISTIHIAIHMYTLIESSSPCTLGVTEQTNHIFTFINKAIYYVVSHFFMKMSVESSCYD